MYRRVSKTIKILIPSIGISLLILHGFENNLGFKIDTVSAALLLIAFIPYLGSFIQKAKAGQVELSFIKHTADETILSMVKALAEMRMLTYYQPRQPESGLSDAHVALVDYLFKEYKDELREALKVWLKTGSDNVRWMASEIIGYHNMKEMEHYLIPYYDIEACNEQWPEWKLNCLWAHSKIDNKYREIQNFLIATNNYYNQQWLLLAYKQMVLKGHCDSFEIYEMVEDFLLRNDLSIDIRETAIGVLQAIKTQKELIF